MTWKIDTIVGLAFQKWPDSHGYRHGRGIDPRPLFTRHKSSSWSLDQMPTMAREKHPWLWVHFQTSADFYSCFEGGQLLIAVASALSSTLPKSLFCDRLSLLKFLAAGLSRHSENRETINSRHSSPGEVHKGSTDLETARSLKGQIFLPAFNVDIYQSVPALLLSQGK